MNIPQKFTYQGFTIFRKKIFWINIIQLVLCQAGISSVKKHYTPIEIKSENGTGTISGTQVRSVNEFDFNWDHHHYGSKKEMRALLA